MTTVEVSVHIESAVISVPKTVTEHKFSETAFDRTAIYSAILFLQKLYNSSVEK